MLGGFGMLVKNPPDRLPWPKQEFGGWESVVDGLVGISLGFAAFLVLAWLFAKYLPKMQFLSGLVLAPFTKGGQMPISMTSTGQTTDVQVRVGDVGQVVSPLRPAGQVKFDSAVVDVVSRAEFIENGVTVSIIEIHGNRVIVQPIEN
jgi:membrane-bound serine protease (ClpP class)